MTETKTEGHIGLPLTSLHWLTAHHESKLDERRKMIEIHGLNMGDRVLDIACGPGLWTELLLSKVGNEGFVAGLDIDAELIAHAEIEYQELITQNKLSFHVGDMRKLPFEDKSFDTVICGNAYNYLAEEELGEVVEEHMRVLRPGGSLSIRAFDNTMSMYHPISSTVLLSVMLGVAKSLESQPSFDNYLGSKLHGLLASLSLGPVNTHTFVTQKTNPMSDWSREYVRMKALWYAEKAQGYCPDRDLAVWRSHFDPDSEHYILDRSDFYFNTTEMISTVIRTENF